MVFRKTNKELTDKINDFAKVFSDDEGKRVLTHLESFCGQSRVSVGDTYNPYQTMYLEGQRSVYVYIQNMLRQEEQLRKEKKND